MKVGDLVVVVATSGSFGLDGIKANIERFYEDDKVIIVTEAGHEWMVAKSDLRVIKERNHSTWNY